MYLFGNISISGWCRVRGYPHYINTPRYAGLYSRDIIAMVAGGEGDGGGGSSHTVSVCSYDQISGLAVILTR